MIKKSKILYPNWLRYFLRCNKVCKYKPVGEWGRVKFNDFFVKKRRINNG